MGFSRFPTSQATYSVSGCNILPYVEAMYVDCMWFLPLNFYIFSCYYPKGNSEWKFGKSVALKKKKKNRKFWEHKDNLHKESKCWTIFVLFHFNRRSNKVSFVWLLCPGSLILYAWKFLSVVWMTPPGPRTTVWTSNEYCLCTLMVGVFIIVYVHFLLVPAIWTHDAIYILYSI